MAQMVGLTVFFFVIAVAAVFWAFSLRERGIKGLSGAICRGGVLDGTILGNYDFLFDVDNGRFVVREDDTVSSLVGKVGEDGQTIFYILTHETEGPFVVARPYDSEPVMGEICHPIATWGGEIMSITTSTEPHDGSAWWYEGKEIRA